LPHKYNDIISLENLFLAWQEFVVGKRGRRDVQEFSEDLMDNIVSLHHDLASSAYCHGGYESFYVYDPKRRHIHKASVRDRLLHHAIYRILYPFFDHTFIADSYSCRKKRGVHKAINRFRSLVYKVNQNNTQTCWALKCDIRKFFANIDHKVLERILGEYIPDEDILWLLRKVIHSFNTGPSRGLPLGNLTSQVFVNVYMNVFDQFMKHRLKAKYYLRNADDFVILSHGRDRLQDLIPEIRKSLFDELKLTLHPNKISIETVAFGVDFLGWVHFIDHRVLRASTRRRMLRRIQECPTDETVQSYLGLLKHGNTFGLREEVLDLAKIK